MSETSCNRPITVDDLPATLQLDDTDASTWPGTALVIVGVIMLLLGGVTLLTGPDYISYNPAVGMTFEQMIQAYPGPIVSVGLLIIVAGQAVSGSISKGNAEALAEQLASRVSIPDEDIPEGYQLHLEGHGGPHYTLRLVAIEELTERVLESEQG